MVQFLLGTILDAINTNETLYKTDMAVDRNRIFSIIERLAPSKHKTTSGYGCS